MSEDLSAVQLHLVETSEDAASFIRWLGERRPLNAIGLDTETGELPGERSNGALSPWHGDLRLIQIGDSQQGWAIPWDLWKGVFYESMSKFNGPIVIHNSAFEAKFFEIRSTWKMPWHQMHDTMIMAHLIDPLGSGALKALASKYVDPKSANLQGSLDQAFATNGWTWGTVPTDFPSYWCVPLDTEILTRSGWKNYADVQVGDQTLGYRDGKLEWTDVQATQTFNDAPLVTVGNKYWSTTCTPQHRWVYESHKYLKGEYDGYGDAQVAPLDEIWSSHHNRLVLAAPAEGGDSPLTPDEAAMVAWLLSDGSIYWQHPRSSPIASITQHPNKFSSEIRDLLRREDAYVSERVQKDSGCIRFYVRSGYVTALWEKANLFNENYSSLVLGLSREARKAWWGAWYMAEGAQTRGKERVISQNFGPKFDALVLTVYMEGFIPRIQKINDKHGRIQCGTRKPTPQKSPLKRAGTSDVWCPVTGLGTWTARDRDGRVFVTGNTYGALDPVITMRLFEQFYPLCGPDGPYHEAYELEMATRRIVTRMEINGARVDLDYCRTKRDDLLTYTETVKEWVKTKYGYSITSNAQLVKLFDDLGAVSTERTPSGAKSMNKDQIKKFSISGSPEVQTLANAVLAQRKADKLATTYFDNFLTMNDDGILHPSVKTLGARTGRMSITDPALQTLPTGDATVRRAFIPRDPDNIIIASDLDQVEFRIVAAMSQDPQLIEMFYKADAEGSDSFTEIMRDVYQDPTLAKSDPRRKLIKSMVYGRLYGAGIAKQALTAGVPEEQMRAVSDAFDRNYPGVRQFQQAVEDVGMRRLRSEGQGYVLTKTGRRLPCDDDRVYTLVNYCFAPDTPVLTSGLQHVPASSLRVGDRLVAFDEHPVKNPQKAGGKSYSIRRWRTAVVEAVSLVYKPTLRLTLSDGRTVDCSNDHLWLCEHQTRTQPRTRWIRADEVRPGTRLHTLGQPWEVDTSRDGGWLAGMYDGEGCLRSRNMGHATTQLIFSQLTGDVMIKFRTAMEERNLPYRYQVSSPNSTSPTDSCITTSIYGILNILGVLQPDRFKSKFESVYEGGALVGGSTVMADVVSIEDIGIQELSSIQTSTRTLIANGILSHNCVQSSAAEVFKANLVKLDQQDLTEFLIVPVHDEIVLECPREQAAEVMPIVRECMTTREGWAVPLTAGVEGPFDNWGQKYE